jgi:hypothetical protein
MFPFRFRRVVCQFPELSLGRRELVILVFDRYVGGIAADKQELAVIGNENLVVLLPIIGDLLRVGDLEYGFVQRFAFDDAATGIPTCSDFNFSSPFTNWSGVKNPPSGNPAP